MNSPAIRPRPAAETGTARAARLMRALGPDAGGLWAELTPAEVRLLSGAMDEMADDPAADAEAARLFADAARRFSEASRPGQPGGGAAASDVWKALSALPAETLAGLVQGERPQTAALILSRLGSEAAAKALRALPSPQAVEAMRRLLHPGTPNAAALASLEDYLARRLASLSGAKAQGGHERVAQIFDRLDSRAESVFLAALESAEPGAGRKVRSLMFIFDDLAGLDAAGLQTLLASANRATLTIALKGAKDTTANAFFSNMTQRAGDLLRDEIAALGALRRSEVEAARQEIVSLAREMIRQGEIRPGAGRAILDDELIE